MLETDYVNPFGGPVYYIDTVDSTMDEVRRMICRGVPPGFVLFTGYQKAGRGRLHERRWLSREGEGLLFTLSLKKDDYLERLSLLPMVCALGLARSLENLCALHCRIKWPNDLLCQGRKISGILCESYGNCIAIGIGLNVRGKEQKTDGAYRSASILSMSGRAYEPSRLLAPVLEGISAALEEPAWHEAVSALLYKRGERVRIAVGDPRRQDVRNGTLEGLGPRGELVLLEEGGKHSYVSAEFLSSESV